MQALQRGEAALVHHPLRDRRLEPVEPDHQHPPPRHAVPPLRPADSAPPGSSMVSAILAECRVLPPSRKREGLGVERAGAVSKKDAHPCPSRKREGKLSGSYFDRSRT